MEFSVAAADRRHHGLTVDLLLGVFTNLVAAEGGDLAQVEVRQQDAHDDLCGAESADVASAGGFDLFGAVAFDLAVQGLDAVASMGVEFIPFLRSVLECLSVAPVVGGVEGYGVLTADLVGEVGQVFSVDSRSDFIRDGLDALPVGCRVDDVAQELLGCILQRLGSGGLPSAIRQTTWISRAGDRP